jgi:hypothetical protein
MIEKGDYQNQVPSLSALAVTDYERIFKIFKASLNDKDFYYYNILKKIEFPEIDSSFLDTYEVAADMAWTIVSYKIYGDIKSWWILYLLNVEQYDEAPFLVKGGTKLKFIIPELRSMIYQDITQATVFGGRHY